MSSIHDIKSAEPDTKWEVEMLKYLAAIALAASGAPAFAGTLQEVTTRGIVLTIQGVDIDIAYTPDGKFTGFGGQLTGSWRIEGDSLCTTSPIEPQESCTVYPADKKSGDAFDLPAPDGAYVSVRIK